MKKRLLVTLLVAMFLTVILPSFSVVFAGPKIQVNGQGEIRFLETEGWRDRSPEELEAAYKPGTEVPIYKRKSTKYEKVDFFSRVSVQGYNEVVVWNRKKFEILAKKGEYRGKPIFGWHVFFAIFAILIILSSNILVYNKKYVAGGYVFAVGAFFAILAGVFIICDSILIGDYTSGVVSIFAVVCGAGGTIGGIVGIDVDVQKLASVVLTICSSIILFI